MKQADLVIKNAKIYTNGTFFQGAVAVRDGMIASVCTDSEIPVSYTHLDVYKRQAINRFQIFIVRTAAETAGQIVHQIKWLE